MEPGVPRLDGHEVVGAPARFYRRRVLGEEVFGLWIGGDPVYDVAVYDAAVRQLGVIDPEGSAAAQAYDALRRALVTEAIQA